MLRYRGANLIRAGIIGVILIILVIAVGLQPERLLQYGTSLRYHALFSEAGGLANGNDVTVSGIKVGTVSSIELDNGDALVGFTINSKYALGSETTAHIRTGTLLGERMKEIAREVFQEIAPDYIERASASDEAAAKLRAQLALIKAKEHVTVKEAQNRIIFLRTVEAGAADRSYGIEVAKLAGIPSTVTQRAREILKKHEENEHQLSDNLTVRSRRKPKLIVNQLSLFTALEEELRIALRQVDVENLTPLEALRVLAELKNKAT